MPAAGRPVTFVLVNSLMRDEVTEHAVWPVLPLQDQLAPWPPMFIGLAIVVAFVILVVVKSRDCDRPLRIEPAARLV
jgi:hypothetical protein